MRLSPLFGFALAILWLCACSEPIVPYTETDPDTGFTAVYGMHKKTGKYEGPYTRMDSTGVLLERGNYRNGALQGIRELYYPDGTVKVRERHEGGEMIGLYEYFYPDGKPELWGYYIDGAMYGLWRKYAPEGYLLEEVMFSQNEERGPFWEYHPDGTLKVEGTYLNGPEEEGRLNLYDPSGKLYKTMWCQHGRCYTTWEREE